MNKGGLIAAIAQDSRTTKINTEKFLNSMVTVIVKALKKGEKISVSGFMSFAKVKRAARIGQNPQTGKKMQIAAKNVVKIRAGKRLSDAVR